MYLEYYSWFFVAVILGVEYGLKEYFELLPGSVLKRKSSYWLYRFLHWLILTVLLSFFFASSYPWFIWPLLALGTCFIGSIELIAYSLEDRLRKTIQHKSYLLQVTLFLINGCLAFKMAMLIHIHSGKLFKQFLSWLTIHFKGSSLTGAKILATGTVFILLAYPVNYIIRWLIGKTNDKTLPELISSKSNKKAEYYLVGTLYSAVFAIVLSLILINLR